MIGRLFAQDAALYADIIMDKPENLDVIESLKQTYEEALQFFEKAIAKALLILSIRWENGLGSIQINSCKRAVSYCNKRMIYVTYKAQSAVDFHRTFVLWFIVLPSVNFVECPQS